MNPIYKLVTASALSLVIASPVLADRQSYCDHDWEDRIERRLDRQYQRIQHGIDQHSLTHKESKHLKKKHRKIRRLSREYREDGYLSRKEFKRLTRKLDRLSDRIWEYKHNELERYVIYHDKYAHKNKYW
jgi:septal ring factor EnvC (AmiA/AmiB activator)